MYIASHSMEFINLIEKCQDNGMITKFLFLFFKQMYES